MSGSQEIYSITVWTISLHLRPRCSKQRQFLTRGLSKNYRNRLKHVQTQIPRALNSYSSLKIKNSLTVEVDASWTHPKPSFLQQGNHCPHKEFHSIASQQMSKGPSQGQDWQKLVWRFMEPWKCSAQAHACCSTLGCPRVHIRVRFWGQIISSHNHIIWSQKYNEWLSVNQGSHHFLQRLMLISACRSRLSGFTSQKEW